MCAIMFFRYFALKYHLQNECMNNFDENQEKFVVLRLDPQETHADYFIGFLLKLPLLMVAIKIS